MRAAVARMEDADDCDSCASAFDSGIPIATKTNNDSSNSEMRTAGKQRVRSRLHSVFL